MPCKGGPVSEDWCGVPRSPRNPTEARRKTAAANAKISPWDCEVERPGTAMCLIPPTAAARASAMAVQQNARRKRYCFDIIREKDRPGEGIRLRHELHSGGHCRGQAKLLIQTV